MTTPIAPRHIQIVCGRRVTGGCGFRVDADYYVRKVRFLPGVCPRCGGPIDIVRAFSDAVLAGWRLETNPRSEDYRLVVPVSPEPAEVGGG